MTLEPEDLEEFEILNYFEDDYQEYWREQMLRTDREGAKELVKMLEDKTYEENSTLLMLTDGESLISYCFATPEKEIKYLYTFESYRGNGCAKKLISEL